MKKNLEKTQLNYLLSLSKKNPQELLYLLNLHYPLIIIKREDFLSSKDFLGQKNGFLSILDIGNESRHMHTEIDYDSMEKYSD